MNARAIVQASKCGSLLAVFIAILLPAGTAMSLEQVELEMNRALWDSHHITDYDFVLGRSCFCEPTYGLPGLVSVRMGQIVSVVDVATGQPRNLNEFFTIDALFDSLQQGLDSDTTEVTAQFDPQLGYPRMARFDVPILADDDITYGVSSFMAVPEPQAAFILATGSISLAAVHRRRRPR